MENLVLLGERRRGVNLPDDGSGDYIVDVCQVLSEDAGSETAATVVLTKNGLLSRITENGDASWTCNLEEVKSGGGWFDVSYNDPELVCLSKCGAIISVAPSTGEADVVGVFEYGLEAASWSPDGEVLLMVTSSEDDEDETKTKSVLIAMNTQFEVLAEVTIPSFVPSPDHQDVQVSVAWRPDGSLCAVSSIDEGDKMRKVRMYKRETLELHAIGRSEDASGSLVRNLQPLGLAWASSGCSQVLASVQRKGKKTQQVVFFESNGLRHRELLLREPPTTNVTSLIWNVDSDLLALALREEGGTGKVQLWHRCNYHWSLKQELRYPGQQVVGIKFDAEKSSDFSVFLNGLEWREYEVRWDPSTTSAINGNYPAFVVDGCSLNTTPLDKALIPPPMFMSQYTMDFPISETFFCRSGDQSGSVLVKLSDGNIALLQKNAKKQLMFDTRKIKWSDQNDVDTLSLRSYVVVHEEAIKIQVVAVACAEKNEANEKLIEITISGLDTSEPVAEVGNALGVEGRVLRMSRWADALSGCILQMQDGSLIEYEVTDDEGFLAPSESEPLLEPCPWICAIKHVAPFFHGDDHDERHPRLVFGLSTKSRLYFHDMMLTDSASSLFLSMEHEFLCYATAGSRCQVRFLNLYDLCGFDSLMGPDQFPVLEGYEPRNVERGARIVAILPSQLFRCRGAIWREFILGHLFYGLP
jgi:elongator complex protein 1